MTTGTLIPVFYLKMDGRCETETQPRETEFIIIGNRHARESHMQKFLTQLLGNSVSRTDEVKNLGVLLTLETLSLVTYYQSLLYLLLSPQGPNMHPKIPQ